MGVKNSKSCEVKQNDDKAVNIRSPVARTGTESISVDKAIQVSPQFASYAAASTSMASLHRNRRWKSNNDSDSPPDKLPKLHSDSVEIMRSSKTSADSQKNDNSWRPIGGRKTQEMKTSTPKSGSNCRQRLPVLKTPQLSSVCFETGGTSLFGLAEASRFVETCEIAAIDIANEEIDHETNHKSEGDIISDGECSFAWIYADQIQIDCHKD